MSKSCDVLCLKSTQLFIVAGTVVLTLLVSLLCIGITIRYEVDHEVANPSDVDYWRDQVSPQQQIWYEEAIEELQQALRIEEQQRRPKNVWIFVVDGIGSGELAAARFTQANGTQSHAHFVWDQFPQLARIKNSCSRRMPCNAVAVQRALWTGLPLKAFPSPAENCSHRTELKSLLEQAQLAGFRTGFVTNQRLTGATGAALYAESSWECDGVMPLGSIEAGCQDVAQQLISSPAGQGINMLMGGGRQLLSDKVPKFSWDPLDERLCRARTGRNLLRDWRNQKLKLNPGQRFELVQQAHELSSVNASSLDYLLGVLANGDLSSNSRAPDLQLILNKTLQVLQRPGPGHLLIVEHVVGSEMAAKQRELQLLNETLSHLGEQRNTLILVLLSSGSYTSPSWDVSGETEAFSDLEEAFEQSEQQLQLRLQEMFSERLLFAKGPKSSLFYGVHEETYLTQALSYALGLNAFGNQL